MQFGFNWPSAFGEEVIWKCWQWQCLQPANSMKLTYEPNGSVELKIWILFGWTNKIKTNKQKPILKICSLPSIYPMPSSFCINKSWFSRSSSSSLKMELELSSKFDRSLVCTELHSLDSESSISSSAISMSSSQANLYFLPSGAC